jgi:hypothetical protein
MNNAAIHWQELIQGLNSAYGLALPEKLTEEQLEALLAEKLNEWIRDDFSGLVQMLYRIDINELRLRQLLQTNDGQDAGMIIARLIIERQKQKIESRRKYTPPDTGSDEERW